MEPPPAMCAWLPIHAMLAGRFAHILAWATGLKGLIDMYSEIEGECAGARVGKRALCSDGGLSRGC